MTASHEPIGQRFLFLKHRLETLPVSSRSGRRISYQSDHTKQQLKHAVIYCYYDAQCALTPFLIDYKKVDADYFILDFTSSAALENYCQEQGLRRIVRQNGIALARRMQAENKMSPG